MTNKINKVPQHKTIPATPATPDTGFGKIYIKSDGSWYGLDDQGVETLLSGGGSGTGVSGSGTLNYLTKWTPDGTTLGNSIIRDNGDKVAIGFDPDFAIGDFNVVAQSGICAIDASTGLNGGYAIGGGTNAFGSDPNHGIIGSAFNSSLRNIGVLGQAGATINGSTNIGLFGYASGTGISIGLCGEANIGAAERYGAQLVDGTQASGKFLKSVTSDGKANWANITAADVSGVQGALTLTTTGSSGAATLVGNTLNIPQYSGGGGGGVSGSGTLNKLTKWTPNGTTIGNSAIIEDSNGHIGIGDDPLTSSKTYISTTTESYGLRVDTENIDGSTGVYATSSKQGSNFNNQGVRGIASGSTTENIGIYGTASADNSSYASKQMGARFFAQNGSPSITSDPGAIAIGVLSNASNQYGGIAYFAQFIKYGVSSLNKVVLSDNLSGYADWGKVTSSYTTGATGTFTSADGKTITVTNGLITSIV